MSTSSIPAVLTYLAGSGVGDKTSGLWPGTATFIGEPPQGQYGDFVAVAWAGPENAAVQSQPSLTNAAGMSGQESYTVAVQLVTWGGKTDLAATTARAYALLDTLWDALAADPHLGGAVSLAHIADHSLAPDQTDKGAMTTLSVTLAVEAFRT